MAPSFHPFGRVAGVVALIGILIAALSSIMPTSAAPWSNRQGFANPEFQRLWIVADDAVAKGTAARSYTWGPRPWFDYREVYNSGNRLVQYFDKARMEYPNDGSSVTNGLLVVELVAGRLKVGDSTLSSDNLQRQPAEVPIAGDPARDNAIAPTYASFRGVTTTDNGYRDRDQVGQRVVSVLDRAGVRSINRQFANDPATEIVVYNTITGHNIPRVFNDFIQNGPINGTFAFGYPISDAYWVRANVSGVERDVLVQLFERRVVTYTPSNPASFRVEMGNVGQHYFQWRYAHLGQPWQANAEQYHNLPIAFASKRSSQYWETFLMNGDGNNVRQVTSGQAETVPYSWRRGYAESPSPRLMTDSRRVNGRRHLFSISLNDFNDIRSHTTEYANSRPLDLFNPAISHDGLYIASVIDDDRTSSLLIQPFDGEPPYPLQLTGLDVRCRYQSPTWLPDGSGLVFAVRCGSAVCAAYPAPVPFDYNGPPGGVNCNDRFAIVRATMYVTPSGNDGRSSYTSLVNVKAIVDTPDADNLFPRVSPDGSKVVFASNHGGQVDLYTVNIDGSGLQRLTNDVADDGAASWSPSSQELVFDSNREGDYEIYKLDLANPSGVVQLTNNGVDDRWPLWVQ